MRLREREREKSCLWGKYTEQCIEKDKYRHREKERDWGSVCVFAFGYLLTVQSSKMTGECCFCFLELETMTR